ncbi:extracellular calcium-sensing receptor-like [Erpetoichthys calabaricus]|uniref:extracellular calcium-sensing receptor-like n=1 Tax=Erpetoichthys calabaricus TaxID=27687 RepID=UPI0022343239|nr:extracellular calcium-sensing receptor-like [Erpetoichthys calabaricus]
MLGGTFIVNFKTIPPDLTYRSKPENWKCDGFEISVFQRAQAMIFAIEEINKNQTFLPNITLGYRLYDDCNNVLVGLRATIALTGGLEEDITDYNCKEYPPVLAIVGDPLSSHSIATSRILSVFQIPMVSYFATCSCLSNKQDYPTFFRTIPSDTFQVKAIVQIIKHYGWTWIGAIATDDDYGQNALKDFIKEIQTIGCIAFTETIPIVNEKVTFLKIVSTIKKSSANVIVVFSSEEELSALVKEVVQQNITGKQWIASESWSTSAVLAVKENFVSFGGTIGIAIRKGEIPGLKNFLQQSYPNFNSQNNLMVEFWETLFQCKFQNATNQNNFSSRVCSGSEDIKTTKTAYNDVTDLRSPYTVYKAVYAIAHSLHDLTACKTGEGPFLNNSCANIRNVQPWQLLYYLKKVSFVNHLGERVTFDENGDPPAIYDIVNWQLSNDETVDIKIVGLFDESLRNGKELSLNEKDIFWNFATGTIPESVCSKSCLLGTRKATRKGEPICCFDCIPCADGEISSQNDSTECFKCPPDYWSNLERSECIQKEIEFLSYDDAMGITLTATSALGACLSLSVLAIFIQHRHTPVVKANNSELSFLLLVSLTLCFLCVLCFIGKPSEITCTIRHVVFGLSFAVCISCILVKTIVVIMAFKATLPGNNMVKWFGTSQQRGTVFFTAFIQSIICLIWLTTAPPLPNKNTKYQNSKIIFECHVGSLIGFSCLLGYIGLLACICFLLAFLARNLPDTFNEAKFITFSMLIFCAVWITFVPAYISSPGKHTVAVEIFAILASSFGLLFSIFAPKCYIILLRPELNTKKALMGRAGQNK